MINGPHLVLSEARKKNLLSDSRPIQHFYSYFGRLLGGILSNGNEVSCSSTQHRAPDEDRTRDQESDEQRPVQFYIIPYPLPLYSKTNKGAIGSNICHLPEAVTSVSHVRMTNNLHHFVQK